MTNLDQLSAAEKRALLEKLLREKVKPAQSQSYPLSYAQERLWFLDQFQPGLPVYNLPLNLHFPGPLNVAALRRSLEEIVSRQAALRTTFRSTGGRPMQVVTEASLEVPLIDLREMPVAMREVEVQRLIAREAAHVFDLAAGPLFRATLVRVADDDHRLLLNMHHIISDGWSTGVLMRELTALYAAHASGRNASLPDLPLQYGDFARRQREELSGERLERELSYWRGQLESAPVALELPTDRPRPPVSSFRGAWQPFTLRPQLSEALKDLGRAYDVTLFMTLLAAFIALLHRYTRQEDLVVGTPIANRNRGDIEGLIGFFVNTLALRIRPRPLMTFAELLRDVREVTLGAYAHQDLPFEKIVEEIQPERSLSHSPVFQVMFALQNTPGVGAQPVPSEIEEDASPVYLGLAKFDLTLSFAESSEILSGGFEYSTDLFDHATIARMIRYFRRLLTAVAADPLQPLSELPLLSDSERDELLQWGTGPGRDIAAMSVAGQFQAQAVRTPDAEAVVSGTDRRTYAELQRMADDVAARLQRAGIGPESRVGVLLERGVTLPAAILGLLKAGAAYVPLDPAYPRERLAYIAADARLDAVVTERRHAALLEYDPATVIHMDEPGHPTGEPFAPVAVTPDHLMAIIYTSGSTGRPKGALLTGRGFLNLFQWFGEECRAAGATRVLLMTPFAFDASFKMIVTPLLTGGTLILAESEAFDAQRILALIEKESVATTFLTPSILYALLDEAKSDDYRGLSSLRAIFFGGESTNVVKLRSWINSPNCHCQLVHNYGPSECSDAVTVYKPARDEVNTLTDLPIGVPIPNARLYVLDGELKLQPPGIAGDLYISGPILARGYANLPALTDEKFIANPYLEGMRLYRTGDRARWLPSGNLQFLGRDDDQVKIRGMRIELGEIEAVLSQHPDVRGCVVLAREVMPGDKRLIAYAVSGSGELDAFDLRRHLKQQLPDYMVPPYIVPIGALPLLPNGKVNRNALPLPDHVTTGFAADAAAPRTPVEEAVAGIWAEVLNLPQIGIHDNFFDMGGHSLLATQIASRIRDAFQLDVPVRRLFEFPTVADLSAWMVEEGGEAIEQKAALLLEIVHLSDEDARARLRQRTP